MGSLVAELVHSLSFVFISYHTQDDGIVIFDRIAEKIDIFSDHLSAIIYICGGTLQGMVSTLKHNQ